MWFLILYLDFLFVIRKTGTFFSLPLTFIGESFLEQKDPLMILYTDSDTIISPGPAAAHSLEATLTVSPITV